MCSFMFQKIKYVYEDSEFSQVRFPVDLAVGDYVRRKGFTSEEEVRTATEKYGQNKLACHCGGHALLDFF